LKNDENTARVYALCGAKEEFAAHEQALAEIVGAPKATELIEKAKTSYGVEFTKTERDAVRTLAALTAAVYAERAVLQEFVEASARENARNLSTLIEPLLAARLISLAGGLEKLARMSASTIQVIGAEKALFKHLRSGVAPPKHGLIFQSPLINAAPLHQRGKIARALATKLCIAAKADWFTGNFIAPKLKATLEARLAQIRSAPEPSEERKRQLRANEQRRQAERQRDWREAKAAKAAARFGNKRRGFKK
jgi:nucleolar protein 56